ncbi:ATP dependent DNA ligase [Nonomuraea sp. KM90]|uniref:ATP dependent DNA ligase n=1 Tax=Nonomuraea sp. KM90 TaxID=3457428 RepID=UPI003FCD5926
MRPLQQQRNPFTGQRQDELHRGVCRVRPELVGEVRVMEWTANRHLRLARPGEVSGQI